MAGQVQYLGTWNQMLIHKTVWRVVSRDDAHTPIEMHTDSNAARHPAT